MNRRTACRLSLVAVVAVLACRSARFELAELPAEPIALVYRTVQESQRVQEAMEEEDKRTKGKRAEAGRFEVEMEELERLAGKRSAADVLHDQLGRVSFFVAPTERLEPAEFAPRGARPLEWSADRARLLFSTSSRDRLQLFEWIAATGEVRQLTSGDGSHPDGCYGPAGAFAFVEVLGGKRRAPTSRIWIQRPREPARPVTAGPADSQPTWSRDGARLVYVASEPRRADLLRWVDPASGEGGVLTHGRAPVFAPDGQWVVYSAHTAAGWKLWRMRADGSSKRGFGSSAFHENDPAVSPDGRFVVFAATKQERSATSRLFVRAFDGSADRQLELSGSALLPVW